MGSGKPLSRKLVVLGDGACGKCSQKDTFQRLTTNLVDGAYILIASEPTVFENYVELMQVDEQLVELSLWDTAGQEEFDRLRSLSYADTHVVLLCFSVDSPDSLENVEAKWIEEIKEHCAGVKVILIALKCDLRDDEAVKAKLGTRSSHTVTYEQGLAVARSIRAARYLECSAKHNRGVQEVIYEAAQVAVGTRARGAGGGGGAASARFGKATESMKGCGCVIS